MLAHRCTQLMWPLLGRMSGTLKAQMLPACTHTHETAPTTGTGGDSNSINKNNCVMSAAYTWAVKTGKIQRHRWRVECMLVRMCKYMYSMCGCLVPFPMNCINPYADWEKPVLFPISSWLTAVYLWVCRHRPTGASDSHTHKHTHTQGTSFSCIENTLQRLSMESWVFL